MDGVGSDEADKVNDREEAWLTACPGVGVGVEEGVMSPFCFDAACEPKNADNTVCLPENSFQNFAANRGGSLGSGVCFIASRRESVSPDSRVISS